MFGSIGMPELIIILVIALIIFGPRKLPELGKSLGRSINEFKRASTDLQNTSSRKSSSRSRRRQQVKDAERARPLQRRRLSTGRRPGRGGARVAQRRRPAVARGAAAPMALVPFPGPAAPEPEPDERRQPVRREQPGARHVVALRRRTILTTTNRPKGG